MRFLRAGALGLAALAGAADQTAAQSNDAALPRLAQIESALALIQDEMKRLTGRLEKSEFENTRLQERLQSIEAKLQQRTSALQVENTGLPRAAQLSTSRPEDENTITNPKQDSPDANISANNLAPNQQAEPLPLGQQILGTINREALLGVDSGQISLQQKQPVTALDGLTPGELYNKGVGHLERGEWPDAIDNFRYFVDNHQSHELASNAGFWLGESLFYSGDYASAAAQFARNYQSVGETGPRAEENLLKVGLSLIELGDFERACPTLDQLEMRYPSLANPLKQALLRARAAASCP